MAHAQDIVQIAVEDKDCRGVTSPDGRKVYDAYDHVVELPKYEADRIMRAGVGPAQRYTKSWSMGIDLKALEAARKEQER